MHPYLSGIALQIVDCRTASCACIAKNSPLADDTCASILPPNLPLPPLLPHTKPARRATAAVLRCRSAPNCNTGDSWDHSTAGGAECVTATSDNKSVHASEKVEVLLARVGAMMTSEWQGVAGWLSNRIAASSLNYSTVDGSE